MPLHLMSYALCPYVQRAAISMTEKGVAFERTTVDLANKPEWFLGISPLGKTPVLTVENQPIFESAAILEYLEETQPLPLHPSDPLTRAQHRGWIEFGSAILNDIAGFYAAKNAEVFAEKTKALSTKFFRLEEKLADGPYFLGDYFSLVDAVYGPVFRYFDTFDKIDDFGILSGNPKVQSWRLSLSKRASVRDAVPGNYSDLLWTFLLDRKSHLSAEMIRKRDIVDKLPT